MNHVTNHSPVSRNIFYRVLITCMIFATIMVYPNYCGDTTCDTGEEVAQHETMQPNTETEITEFVSVYKPMKVIAASPQVYDTQLEVLEEEPIRENTLYYVIDDGYEYYLDDCYQDFLYEMCIKYDVVEYYTLFLAQMYHESSFRVDVISRTRDHGLMQINECNHEWLGKELGDDNFLDPYTNIEAGVYMMSGFLHKYNDVQKALVCYNRGESAVINGTYSTDYSRGVLSDMNLLVELE